ncbi:MAG TPA: ABC-F family ATP-binding cassette domain-containing protein [Spirochaetota bacterium]|nr:ABC-F family ATP-binding cassette domain-containing protein [Spirochaetota bacterium]HOS33275.1 ABC-F family ATP-binding cassette domain-containing protein [Spirochaetota bacterium]HOS56579.1 ABC-F family ATP-binding cassette domain-containing protein [Spirochaetota bacterium]HQF78843.1 ABC-F family ATP-binding cassette domain-containing protein [Spirochaetota bacterium]HQH30251.1 ABC-F family ATP-binding cassette domain-containing protein [Spirochaetota bacterium]
MISISELTKSYGAVTLFEKISFNVNRFEKIGLVGRNGRGKTTLFRLILGEEEPDSGDISIPKGYRIGCLKQNIHFTKNTALEESALGLKESDKENVWKCEKVLSGLGFSQSDMGRNPTEFSGGYQVRINLAKLLLSEPDLLLLDEPSNYLDILSVRWLIKFLNDWKSELILITHDRNLMDKVITHTVAIHRQGIKKIAGDTEKMYQKISSEEELYEKTRINDEKKRKDIEQFINRFRAKATLSSRVQSKVKSLEKAGKLEKLSAIENLEFYFNYRPIHAKSFFEAKNLSYSYNSSDWIIKDFSITIAKNDKIAIIGKNGKGKTTLLKLLSGKLTSNTGGIVKHNDVEIGYFEQTNVKLLDNNKTVEEEIDAAITNRDKYSARNIAGAMMFEGDLALKKIAALSGGEKSRVMLGKLIAAPVNLLLLDEPTNHLDIQSADSLLEALEEFEGALLIATHNEMYLRALANRMIIFDKGEIKVFEGGYDDFLEKIGWDEELEKEEKTKEKTEEKMIEKDALNKKEVRKIRAQIISEKSKELKPIELNIKKIEQSIYSLEEELDANHKEFESATIAGDGETIKKLLISINSLEKNIEQNYLKLDELTNVYDEKSAIYEERLEQAVAE